MDDVRCIDPQTIAQPYFTEAVDAVETRQPLIAPFLDGKVVFADTFVAPVGAAGDVVVLDRFDIPIVWCKQCHQRKACYTNCGPCEKMTDGIEGVTQCPANSLCTPCARDRMLLMEADTCKKQEELLKKDDRRELTTYCLCDDAACKARHNRHKDFGGPLRCIICERQMSPDDLMYPNVMHPTPREECANVWHVIDDGCLYWYDGFCSRPGGGGCW